MTDEKAHALQDRIDSLMDIVKELIPDDGMSLNEDEEKLVKVVTEMASIRDDIPCSCGEEES